MTLTKSSVESAKKSYQENYDAARIAYNEAKTTRDAAKVSAEYEYKQRIATGKSALATYKATVASLEANVSSTKEAYQKAQNGIKTLPTQILRHGLALWDTLESCTITGASDASIRDVVPNDIAGLLRKAPIRAVFCNGATAYRIYTKYQQPLTGIPAVRLPSTSPANAACSPARLEELWGAALADWIVK